MRLLLGYAYEPHGIRPAQLDLAHLDDQTVTGFLEMLEKQRHAGVATRNARLAAIHSLFSYAAFRQPEHAEQIARVLAIPTKSTARNRRHLPRRGRGRGRPRRTRPPNLERPARPCLAAAHDHHRHPR